MSNLSRFVALLIPTLVLAVATPAPAGAAVPAGATATTSLARVGIGRGYRARPYRSRTRPPYARRYRRPAYGHGFFGGILRALGIAYLFHALFGWGAGGGSPFGLLLLGAVVLLFLGRRRRRPAYY
jgi:MYXO-CTERM domain-containing protein